MHGYPANYLLSGQIVTFFTICICICIRPETFFLSVSVSGQQNAYIYRYLKKLIFDIKFSLVNPVHHLSAPKFYFSEWLRTSHWTYKERTGFRGRWELDCSDDLYTTINYYCGNNFLYLYLAIRPILLSKIICIWLSGKFYYPELSASGFPTNFTIRTSLQNIKYTRKGED